MIRDDLTAFIQHPDALYIGGRWVPPQRGGVIEVIDPTTEQVALRVAEATEPDIEAAVGAAREAFDHGPWPRLSGAERAACLRALGRELGARSTALAQVWPQETGVLSAISQLSGSLAAGAAERYATLAEEFAFEEQATPTVGAYGMLRREPVGVVGAIIAWNSPMSIITHKIIPALVAGCCVVLKSSPEAPGEGYLVAEAAEAAGLPPGVLNMVTADRGPSERLVTDPRVDKISFTGSTAVGRHIASVCGSRVARCTLELGGKSAAVVLDDADLAAAAQTLGSAETRLSGQVCSSLTRIIVTQARHDEFVAALVASFGRVRVGDPFDESSQMGPLVSARQRDRVLTMIGEAVRDGAKLATGGGRPAGLDRGWFVEPTVFASVDNHIAAAQQEFFGPVLCVIPVPDEQAAVATANDTIYGLNASVFTPDVTRATEVARQLRSGTVGHNAMRSDFGMAFGGYKQSGIGREGGREGLLSYLETKAVILDEVP